MGREPAHVQHTFRSGWEARIWRHLPMQWLMQAAITRGDLAVAEGLAELSATGKLSPEAGVAALRLERDVVCALFVSPRVVADEDERPDGWDPEDPERDPIPMRELNDDEIAECLELALQGVGAAAAFRGDTDGTDAGADSAGVGKPPQRARRAAAGKR